MKFFKPSQHVASQLAIESTTALKSLNFKLHKFQDMHGLASYAL